MKVHVNMAHDGINSHLTEVLILEEEAAFIRGDNVSEPAAQCCRCFSSSSHPSITNPGREFLRASLHDLAPNPKQAF